MGALLFGELKTSFHMIINEYTKHAKTLSVKKNSGLKAKVNDWYRRTLRRTVTKQQCSKVTANLNIHSENMFPQKLTTVNFTKQTSMKEL